MRLLTSVLTLVALSTTAYGYSCRNDGTTFYHADVTTGCQVYHRCENGQMSTLSCPAGEAFDHHTSQCRAAADVHCHETDPHHMHKRSVDADADVHSVALGDIKRGVHEVYKAVVDVVMKTVKGVAPSIHAQLERDYAPLLNAVKKDILPIYKDKLAPRLDKYVEYTKNLAGKIFKKIYESYEMSNSTHLNIVSFSDIAQQVVKDIKPVMDMGRYLSSRLVHSSRYKRSIDDDVMPINEVPELMLTFMEPVMKGLFESIADMFKGKENTLTSKVIIPVVKEILADEESKFDLKRILWSAKSAFAPLINEMMKLQSFNSPDGTIIKVPKDFVERAKEQIKFETKPIIWKLMQKHTKMILYKIADHTDLLFEAIRRFQDAKQGYAGVLFDSISNFFLKHKNMIESSDSTHLSSYTLTEIEKDLKPIGITLLQIFMDYLSKLNNSWVSLFFDRNSFLFKSLLGDTSPRYAVPSQDYLKKSKPATPAFNYRNRRM